MEEILTIVLFVFEVVSEHPQEALLSVGTIVGLYIVRRLILRIPWWVWLACKLSVIVGFMAWIQATYNSGHPYLAQYLSPAGQNVVKGLMIGLYGCATKIGLEITRKSWLRRKEPKTSAVVWAGLGLTRGTFRTIRGTARLALGKRKPRSAPIKQTV